MAALPTAVGFEVPSNPSDSNDVPLTQVRETKMRSCSSNLCLLKVLICNHKFKIYEFISLQCWMFVAPESDVL